MNEILPTNTSYIFQDELLSDEKIFWAGQPEIVWLTSADCLIIPFILIAGGCAFAGLIAAILAVCFAPTTPEERLVGTVVVILASIIALPFLFYLFIGRFFYKARKTKHTYYAVTDQRILILTTIHDKSFNSVFINSLPCLNKSISGNGLGTLTFSNSSLYSRLMYNTGLEFLTGQGNSQNVSAFFDIRDANKVYDLINSLRKK